MGCFNKNVNIISKLHQFSVTVTSKQSGFSHQNASAMVHKFTALKNIRYMSDEE